MKANPAVPGLGDVFVTIAAVILPVATFAPLGIAWGTLAPVLWISYLYLRARRAPWAGRSRLLPILLLVFAAYSAASLIWTISPERTLSQAIKFVPIAAGSWLLVGAAAQLDERGCARATKAFLVGSIVAAAALAIEIATDGAIQGLYRGQGFAGTGDLSHLNRGASELAILVWPLWLVLDRRFGSLYAWGGIVLALALLLRLDPDTPVAAVMAGVVFFQIAYFAPRSAQVALITGPIVVALAIPFYPAIFPVIDNALTSWGLGDFTLRHRFAIWEFTAARVMEHPILGWGLDTSRLIPGGQGVLPQVSPTAEALPLHPHNALLQLWLELGIVGIVLGLAILATILVHITRHISGRKELAATLTMSLCAILVAELSYGIWQSWWLISLWVAAALMVAIAGRPAEAHAQ